MGEYRAEIRPAGGADFYEPGGLAGSEYTFALLDIVLTMIRADPRPTPWIILIDSSLFLGLDSPNNRRLVAALTALDEPAVQTVVCLNAEKDAVELTADDAERWVGSTVAGGLTIHSFLYAAFVMGSQALFPDFLQGRIPVMPSAKQYPARSLTPLSSDQK